MKYFIIEATYLVPFEQVKQAIPAHAAWLQQGFASGMFLCSGPREPPPLGGLIVARAQSITQIQTLFETDPFSSARMASYTMKEFHPVMRQGWAEDWFKDAVLPPAPNSR